MTNPSAQAMLEPCPFCGGSAGRRGEFIECADCSAQGPTDRESVTGWNTRAASAPAAVREVLEKIASENTQWDWTDKDTAEQALGKIAVQMRKIAKDALEGKMKIISDHGFPKDGTMPDSDPFDLFKNERDFIAQSSRSKTTVAAMDWAASEIERLRAQSWKYLQEVGNQARSTPEEASTAAGEAGSDIWFTLHSDGVILRLVKTGDNTAKYERVAYGCSDAVAKQIVAAHNAAPPVARTDGVREATIEECAEIADNLSDCSPPYIAEQIRALAAILPSPQVTATPSGE